MPRPAESQPHRRHRSGYPLRTPRSYEVSGFYCGALLTLALAIGANSVVFGILNALILRPVDVPQAESLYGIQCKSDHYGAESYPNYLDLRDRNRSFEDLAAYSIEAAGLDTGNPSRVWLDAVSDNYFDVLRIQPYLGSFFPRLG